MYRKFRQEMREKSKCKNTTDAGNEIPERVILPIVHFNDVYNLTPDELEPIGGAARFQTAVKQAIAAQANLKAEQARGGSASHTTTTVLEPLVLFSGDALSPSAVSTSTRGKHMVDVFNELGVHSSVIGNHELDLGVDNMEEMQAECRFPWLLSNCLDVSHEPPRPLAGGRLMHIIDWHGLRIGLLGLAEIEWVLLLSTVDPNFVHVIDFIECGRAIAVFLKKHMGCDLVIALNHLSWSNDEKLAANAPEIDIILGGHDHDSADRLVGGMHVIKSGADFKQFRIITLELTRNSALYPPGTAGANSSARKYNGAAGSDAIHPPPKIGMADLFGAIAYSTHVTARSNLPYRIVRFDRAEFVLSAPATLTDAELSPASAALHEQNEEELVERFVTHHATENEAYEPQLHPATRGGGGGSGRDGAKQNTQQSRPLFELVDRKAIADREAMYRLVGVKSDEISVTSAIQEDREMKKIVDEYYAELEKRGNQVLIELDNELDATCLSLRTTETNAGNLLCDAALAAVDADAALFNAGCMRADKVFSKGPFLQRDLDRLLPYQTNLVVLGIKGSDIDSVLEAGVGKWPELEGRFPQVGRISFDFDGQAPPGERIHNDTIRIGGDLVQRDKVYRFVINEFIANGQDAYSMLAKMPVLSKKENMPTLNIAVHNYLLSLSALSGEKKASSVHRPSPIALTERNAIAEEHRNAETKSRHITFRTAAQLVSAAVKLPPHVHLHASDRYTSRITAARIRQSIEQQEREHFAAVVARAHPSAAPHRISNRPKKI